MAWAGRGRVFSPERPAACPSVGPSEEPQVGEHVAGIAALPLTHAGRDPLHLPLNAGASGARELDRNHAGLVGDAAALVAAHAAVRGLELLGARAARQLQLLHFLGLKLGATGLSLWHLGRENRDVRVCGMVT